MTDPGDSLLEFPVAFPVKAMGRDDGAFTNAIVDVVAQHADFDPDSDVREQRSRKGNFISVTVTFEAQSREQLDAVYRALHAHERVLMVF